MIMTTAFNRKNGSVKWENPAWKICQTDICPNSKSRLEIPFTNPNSDSHFMVGKY